VNANFRIPQYDIPEKGGVPQEAYKIIGLGKGSINIEILNYKFKIATLEEWEEREIRKRYKDVTFDVYLRLSKVDILTHAIMEMKSGEKIFKFDREDRIPQLRNILLYLSPMILDKLYNAYMFLLEKVEEEFNAKYSSIDADLLDQIKKQFKN